MKDDEFVAWDFLDFWGLNFLVWGRVFGFSRVNWDFGGLFGIHTLTCGFTPFSHPSFSPSFGVFDQWFARCSGLWFWGMAVWWVWDCCVDFFHRLPQICTDSEEVSGRCIK